MKPIILRKSGSCKLDWMFVFVHSVSGNEIHNEITAARKNSSQHIEISFSPSPGSQAMFSTSSYRGN